MRILALGLTLALTGCLTPDPAPPGDETMADGKSQAADVTTSPNFDDPSFQEDDASWQEKEIKQQPFPVIYFGYDQDTLSQESLDALTAVADRLKSQAGDVQIEGHCDSRGTTEYNLALGDRRANAVRNYLVNMGIAQERLSTISYGEEQPAVEGESEMSWAKNRRTIFKLTSYSH